MTNISKQTSLGDFAQSFVRSDNIRHFVDAVYGEAMIECGLPNIRNRHEGYGYIAEQMNRLARSMKGVKTAASDCEILLSGNEIGFIDATSTLFDEALGLAKDVVSLAVHAQNIAREIAMNQQPTPLEEMADNADIEDLAIADQLEGSGNAESNEYKEELCSVE